MTVRVPRHCAKPPPRCKQCRAKWVADSYVKSAADCPLSDCDWRTVRILTGTTLFEVCGSGQSFADFLESIVPTFTDNADNADNLIKSITLKYKNE